MARRVPQARRAAGPSSTSRGSPASLVTALLIAAGAALRVWQYAVNSSLWIDEAALARNVLERSVTALLAPLDFAQTAPAGFLLIEKAIASAAGGSEWALRAFPLACGLASLWLFYTAARTLFSGWTVPFAVGLFSLGVPFVYFSSQVKPYATDVAASLIFLLMAMRLTSPARQDRVWPLALSGAVLVWISQGALIVMTGVALVVALRAWHDADRSRASTLLAVVSVWSLSAAGAALRSVAAVTPEDHEYFRWFWADGFMPMRPGGLSDLLWLPRKVIWIFGAFAPGLGWTNGGLHYRWSPVFALAALVGFVSLWRRRRDTALLLGLPVAVALALSLVRVYPFTARLLVFLTPLILLAVAEGTRWVMVDLPPRAHAIVPVALAVLVGAPIAAAVSALPPSRVQHLRPALEHLHDRFEPGDRMYVFYGAIPAFGYYAPRIGLARDRAVAGRCAVDDPRDYLRQLDAFRGSRVWLVVTHTQRDGELELMLDYLDRIGRRADAFVVPATNGRAIESAAVYLYDLTDARRLRESSAGAFPVTLPALSGNLARWGCYGVTGGEPQDAPDPARLSAWIARRSARSSSF